MKVRDLGEFPLIDRLARLVVRRSPAPEEPFLLLHGIGEDAAVWRTGTSLALLTTDTLVEGVHFLPQGTPWRDLGWKALAVNLSDLASMGGRPLYAVVTLGLPPDTPVEVVDALYEGLLDACEAYGGRVVGGDIVRSPVLVISVALTGTAQGPLLLRSGARPGDQVAVTGPLGASAGGLRLLREGRGLPEEVARPLREAHLRPRPRLAEGEALARAGVRCAIDISDGLVDDLGKVCRASGASARLWGPRVPVHPALGRAFPGEALSLALGGGEDYELLFTAPPEVMARLPVEVTVIGEIVEGPTGGVEVLDAEGRPLPLAGTGWDHLRG